MAAVDFECPFCGRKAHADSAPGSDAPRLAFVDGGGEVPPDPHVLHELPSCEEFRLLDPVAYMQAVNKMMGDQKKIRDVLEDWRRRHLRGLS